jgi:hypothetical protein
MFFPVQAKEGGRPLYLPFFLWVAGGLRKRNPQILTCGDIGDMEKMGILPNNAVYSFV